ncbi:M16 family metallopeptidase [Sphingomonas lacusdianchii]|uniref:M16 family metallopeptidase n=1 Tax=Sphingomonas lacusdianchii TaxID=2917992 RepID=UPI001F573962|nr:pitrilysin family protein [Sphingomonas sp. JXJ CY 53]
MRRSILLAGLALIAAPLAAQTQPPALPAPEIGAPKPFTVPASETYTLPNGMGVTLIPYGNAPKVTIMLRVYAGNLEEGRDTWLSDLTGDMLKEGAGSRDSTALATAAAGMGGNLSVRTSYTGTSINMSGLSEFAPQAVALVGDVARRPTFPAGEFARVKANSARSLAQALAQPGTLADYALARATYGDHPYGRTVPTPAQLDAYTLDQVKRFYATNFGAQRARLYVAGRFDPAAVKAAVEKAFGDWQKGPPRLSLVPTATPGPRVLLVDRPGAPQSTIRLAWPAPLAGSAEDIPMRVANALLGGSFSSRITRNIREDKGYTYSPGSGIDQRPGDAAWTFDADVTTAVTGASLKEVFHEIRTLQSTPPAADEAAGMRSYNAGLFVLRSSDSASLIGQLATRDALGLPADWLDRYVPATMAVSDAQFSSAIKQNLPLDRFTLVVVGDLAKVKPQLDALPELKGVPVETVTVP